MKGLRLLFIGFFVYKGFKCSLKVCYADLAKGVFCRVFVKNNALLRMKTGQFWLSAEKVSAADNSGVSAK